MPSPDTKTCRFCGEEIKRAATLCRFCNRDQPDSSDETVFYAGPGNPPIGQYLLDGVLCLVVVGIFMLVAHILQHRARRYTITSRKISVESGIFSKKIDLLELFRVQDLRFESNPIFGRILVTSTDQTNPVLVLPIPPARAVFDQLQSAVAAARKGSNVRLEVQA